MPKATDCASLMYNGPTDKSLVASHRCCFCLSFVIFLVAVLGRMGIQFGSYITRYCCNSSQVAVMDQSPREV